MNAGEIAAQEILRELNRLAALCTIQYPVDHQERRALFDTQLAGGVLVGRYGFNGLRDAHRDSPIYLDEEIDD